LRADALSLQVAPNVQVVDESSPFRVVVEESMGEADYFAATISNHGRLVLASRVKATRPDRNTISDNVTVKV
jgi:hypothetical protein